MELISTTNIDYELDNLLTPLGPPLSPFRMCFQIYSKENI